MQPHTSAVYAHSCDNGFAIGIKGDALLLCGPRRDLFDPAIGKRLSPYVKCATRIRVEIHPLAILRPSRCRTNAVSRSNGRAGRAAVERNEAATFPEIPGHFDSNHPFVVG